MGKVVTTPHGLGKLINLLKNGCLKDSYDDLVKKDNIIDPAGLDKKQTMITI